MERKTATIDGIPMAWGEAGEGQPVVLIHGIPTGPALWRHVVPRLTGVRCLAFEMVGYAGSIAAGVDRDISVARQADYLAAWLRHLGIDQAVLAGHDLGGGVAHIAAVRHRDLCAGLFLTNAIGYDSWPIPSVKAMRAAGGLVERLPNAAFKGIFASFLRMGHDDGTMAKESTAVHWAHYSHHDAAAAAFVRQVRSLRTEDTLAVADELPRLRLPARLAWGVDDRFQKLRYGERFASALGAPLRRIEGGRHFTPEDHADVIAQEIGLLLEDVASPARAHRAAASG